MNYSKIAVRYAKALFLTASEKNILDELSKDMRLVQNGLQISPELKEVFSSPIIKPSLKKSIFTEVFKKHINDQSLAFFILVIKNGREAFIGDICRNFDDLFRKEKNILEAKLITASVINKKTVEKIKTMLAEANKAEINMINNVDDNLVGGFILKLDEKQLDASVATKLKQMKKSLTTEDYQRKI